MLNIAMIGLIGAGGYLILRTVLNPLSRMLKLADEQGAAEHKASLPVEIALQEDSDACVAESIVRLSRAVQGTSRQQTISVQEILQAK